MDADHDGAAEGKLLHEELTRRIIRQFFVVFNELGPGFLESVYARAMEVALTGAGLECHREVPFRVQFRGRDVGVYRADMIVNGEVLLEIKAASKVTKIHYAQAINYLKCASLDLALILNFGHEPEVKRVILQHHR